MVPVPYNVRPVGLLLRPKAIAVAASGPGSVRQAVPRRLRNTEYAKHSRAAMLNAAMLLRAGDKWTFHRGHTEQALAGKGHE